MGAAIDEILQQQEEGEVESPQEAVEQVNEQVQEQPNESIPDDKPDLPPESDEVNELRQFIREQRKELAAMKAKLSRMQERGEVDDEGNVKVEYSNIEKLQMELHNIAVQKTPALELLVETMELNPKYHDIHEVCSKQNFDDIFETAATNISRKEGRDYNEVLLQLELEVWKKPNPYKYMYSIIKENHPKYQKQASSIKRVVEPKNAPGSVAALGAGENLGSGTWTSSKIDELDESELSQVPDEIYKQYMLGTLK